MAFEEQGARLRRPQPFRVEPIRSWGTAFRRSEEAVGPGTAEQARAEAQTMRGGPVDATVAEGVALGYRVVEDHIRQGRRVAEQLGPGSSAEPANRSAAEEVRDLADKALRFYSDIGGQVMRLLETAVSNVDLLRDPPVGRGPHAPQNPSEHDLSGLILDIQADRPTRVQVDLKRATPPGLAVQSLRTLSGAEPAISDVSLETAADQGPPRLRLRVPAGQPTGLYTGVVMDPATGGVAGTVSVTVGDDIA